MHINASGFVFCSYCCLYSSHVLLSCCCHDCCKCIKIFLIHVQLLSILLCFFSCFCSRGSVQLWKSKNFNKIYIWLNLLSLYWCILPVGSWHRAEILLQCVDSSKNVDYCVCLYMYTFKFASVFKLYICTLSKHCFTVQTFVILI